MASWLSVMRSISECPRKCEIEHIHMNLPLCSKCSSISPTGCILAIPRLRLLWLTKIGVGFALLLGIMAVSENHVVAIGVGDDGGVGGVRESSVSL